MGTAVEKPKDPSKLGRALGRASTNPVNLGVAAAGVTLAIGLGSLPVGILGGLAYLAMVAWDAMTPPKRPSSVQLPSSLPDPKTISHPETRAAVEKIIAAKATLERTLADTPADVITHISGTLATLDQLESYAARLVARDEDITKHLAEVDLDALVEEVRMLTQRAKDASHPDSRKTLEEAKDARMDELRALKDLKSTHETIHAHLARVVAVYGALPTKVVQLRALDAQALDRLSGDMNEELTNVGNELKTSEKVIKSLEVE
ncbi:MAG TPA: hypothetical protein VLB44_09695 [Kofleriaceae bacterium]|nr:hypothetical protein [Kofleriaceae bacterium]